MTAPLPLAGLWLLAASLLCLLSATLFGRSGVWIRALSALLLLAGLAATFASSDLGRFETWGPWFFMTAAALSLWQQSLDGSPAFLLLTWSYGLVAASAVVTRHEAPVWALLPLLLTCMLLLWAARWTDRFNRPIIVAGFHGYLLFAGGVAAHDIYLAAMGAALPYRVPMVCAASLLLAGLCMHLRLRYGSRLAPAALSAFVAYPLLAAAQWLSPQDAFACCLCLGLQPLLALGLGWTTARASLFTEWRAALTSSWLVGAAAAIWALFLFLNGNEEAVMAGWLVLAAVAAFDIALACIGRDFARLHDGLWWLTIGYAMILQPSAQQFGPDFIVLAGAYALGAIACARYFEIEVALPLARSALIVYLLVLAGQVPLYLRGDTDLVARTLLAASLVAVLLQGSFAGVNLGPIAARQLLAWLVCLSVPPAVNSWAWAQDLPAAPITFAALYAMLLASRHFQDADETRLGHGMRAAALACSVPFGLFPPHGSSLAVRLSYAAMPLLLWFGAAWQLRVASVLYGAGALAVIVFVQGLLWFHLNVSAWVPPLLIGVVAALAWPWLMRSGWRALAWLLTVAAWIMALLALGLTPQLLSFGLLPLNAAVAWRTQRHRSIELDRVALGLAGGVLLWSLVGEPWWAFPLTAVVYAGGFGWVALLRGSFVLGWIAAALLPGAASVVVSRLGFSVSDWLLIAALGGAAAYAGWRWWRRPRRPQRRDISLFVRQLGILLRSGVSIRAALLVLGKQYRETLMGAPVEQILEAIEHGTMLSQALQLQAQVFPPLAASLVAMGEARGNLSEVLEQFADYLDREERLQKRVRTALTYPLFVLAMTGALTWLVFRYAIPGLLPMLLSQNVELPFITRVLMLAVNLVNNPLSLLIGVSALALLARQGIEYLQQAETRRALDKWMLEHRLTGRLARNLLAARLARSLATLLGAGVPLLETLGHAADTVGNSVYAEEVRRAAFSVKRGLTLNEHFRLQAALYPGVLLEMLAVGELSGQIEVMLNHAAAVCEGEVEQVLEALLAMLEPVLMFSVSLFVGFVVVALFLPLYGSLQNLS